MKAIKAKKYGGVENLEIVDIPKPQIHKDEVLVKVYYSAVTATDFTMLKGSPFIARLFNGVTRPRNPSGDVFVGEITEKGEEVQKFEVGDNVFGTLAPDSGSHSEFIKIRENKVISIVPTNISLEDAASLVDGPLTAHAFLKKHANIQEGDDVLIIGASGSVGSAAVQLAKYFGANVSAVASGKNEEMVKSLGADNFVDYENTDYTKLEMSFDVIFDTVNKSSFGKCKRIMKDNSIYMTTGPSLGVVKDFLVTRFKSKKAIMAATGPFWKQNEIEFVKKLVEEEHLKPLVEEAYNLLEIKAAFERVGTGHKVGSIVVKIA